MVHNMYPNSERKLFS